MQDKILKFIEKFKAQNSYAPSQATIAKAMNTSRQRIGYHFRNMADVLKNDKYPEYGEIFNEKTK